MVQRPQAGFYSSAVEVQAAATDSNGRPRLEVSGLSGFADLDPNSPERLVGRWGIPAEQADGPLAVRFVACDDVGNCAGQAVAGVVVDRTPPVVRLSSPAFQYSRAGQLTIK